jgi:ubiquinone/menaquinone biosynthesis C-methylase UbiE
LLLVLRGVRLTGLDLSADMLAVARKRAADLAREVDLLEGDAQELPFPDAAFDTVVCTYAMCSVPDECGRSWRWTGYS